MAVDTIDIESNLQAIVFGKKRSALVKIMQKSKTQIYPSLPLPTTAFTHTSILYITGHPDDILKAKQALWALIEKVLLFKHQTPRILTREVTCQSKKIDWIHTNALEKIRKIMGDNSCSIELPSPCSNLNTIKVKGTEISFIDRSIRAIMRLCCDIYASSIQLNIGETQESWTKLLKDVSTPVGKISNSTGVMFVFHRNILDLYGSADATRRAYTLLVELDAIKTNIRDSKFSMVILMLY